MGYSIHLQCTCRFDIGYEDCHCFYPSIIHSATGTAVLLEHEQKQVNEIVGSVSLHESRNKYNVVSYVRKGMYTYMSEGVLLNYSVCVYNCPVGDT